MIKQNLKILALFTLISTSLNAEVIIYNPYTNLTYDSAKNSIMGGTTTATAKGYGAMLSNPAGLSTNHNATIYIKTVAGNTLDREDIEISFVEPGDHLAIGGLYDSFGVEYKVDDYIVGGGAYGYESEYGLFSAGLSILIDQTDLSQKGESSVQDDQFASGDYMTYGLMWQKSFIGLDRYYALYVGMSHKNSGKYTGDNTSNSTVIPTSPSRTSYGFGFETNLDTSSILVTLDIVKEYWQSISSVSNGMSYGVKWLISEKFAVGGGIGNHTITDSIYKDSQLIGIGVEFGFIGIHTNTVFTQRVTNAYDGDRIMENALHLDLAFTF